jgi:hypothetical protein
MLSRFPVALLIHDAGDLFKLGTHSSTATQLQQQEDRSEEQHTIVIGYASSNRYQLSFDGPFVDPQAAMLTHQSLDLPSNVLQHLGAISDRACR